MSAARILTAESAHRFDALEAQASRVIAVLSATGHELVAPSVLQPAAVFLDAIGEALRVRTYVFTDPGGAELCLRPDLTVPVCRLHLERDPTGRRPARYCYNGAAFRYQPAGAGPAHPREFRQAGLEHIGLEPGVTPEASDAQCLALVLDALEAAGLARRRLAINAGDLGLARAILSAVDMPRRWRQRLAGLFWRPEAFQAELHRLAATPGSHAAHLPKPLLDALVATHDTPTAVSDQIAIVGAFLETKRLDVIGARTIEDLAVSLAALARDGLSRPLDPEATAVIERYTAISCRLSELPRELDRLAADTGITIGAAIASVTARVVALQAAGIDTAGIEFSGDFGRSLAYYTGFVFEIGLSGSPATSPLAGGGRYDSLMRACGAPADLPAIGAAIHTERLLAAAGGGAP